MNLKKTSLITILALIYSPLTVAAVYKWVDENNQTHYSAKPESSKAERIKHVQIHDKANPTEKQEPVLEEETLKAKLQEVEAQKTKAQEEAEYLQNVEKVNAYNCKVAQDKHASLDQPRVKAKTTTGFRMMPEEERQAELAKAKVEVSQYCKKN